MADGVEAFPGEASAWAALEAAHIDALRERGELPPTPEQALSADAAAPEGEAPAEPPEAASKPAGPRKPAPRPKRGRGLDADARRRLGHKP